MLAGLADVVDPGSITAIVNTADDVVLNGLHISPDLDTVTYTLAGAVNRETGWGLEGDTWRAMEALARYGGATWFRLGDRDLETHLYRTQRLVEGATLSAITGEIAAAWGLPMRLLPMSDDRVETRVTLANPQVEVDGSAVTAARGVPATESNPRPAGPLMGAGRSERAPATDPTRSEPASEPTSTEIGFQEYFVALRHAVRVRGVRFAGAATARPAPGVVAAIEAAGRIVICPSNPIVSIGPILALPALERAVAARRADVVAVSPIIAGAALKGPADRLMAELGHEPSVVGVARLYAPFAAALVVDEADAALAPAVEAEGLRCVVTPSIMRDRAAAAALAERVVSA